MEMAGKKLPRINHNDAVIFFNLRSDRARQLTKAFVQEDFNKKNPGSFKRQKVLKNLYFVAMTDFGPDLDHVVSAFPSRDWDKTLPMILKDYRQLYIAETEKYAHVTYFFNGGYADPVAGEERIMVPSLRVDSYAKLPKMSAPEVQNEVQKSLNNNRHDFICVNFANPDMIGHTGDLSAAVKCINYMDGLVKQIIHLVLNRNGVAIITADHGNIEEMINLKTGEIDTEHSTNPVPFIIVSNDKSLKIKKSSEVVLGNVAPTILSLLSIDKPREMNCRGLL
jgi:2,3-bisphosphoglycerate-independent phosphoglycerate mutase